MEFEQAYQNLNEQQRAAVDHIDGPLLVIAGPGTGKTQLLSVRVANILHQTDVNPENILCLTFTETGASNMRHRLADFIGPEAYKVQIQTYHAFGSCILQEHRPDLNTAIDDLERFTIIRDIQAKLAPNDILRHDYQTKLIISAISELKEAALSPDDIRKIVNRNTIDNARIFTAIDADLQATKGLRYPKAIIYYRRILETLETFVAAPSNPEYIAGKVEPIANVYYRSLAEAILREESSEKPSTTEMGKWRKKFFDKDDHDRYVVSDEIANKKLLSLANIMELYSKRLEEAGMFDYSDMILMAIDLLQNNDDKRYNAQERYQYILLDEFQDTNDAQAKLVALLTDNPANEGRPNIMAVGDDDQAIYGFQGANTSNFFDFDKKYHPEHIFLTKNYRSSAEILEFSHNIIEQGLDRFCKSPNVNIDKHITAENPPAKTDIQLREFAAPQEEYSFVANRIRELIDAGTPANKIAIITPKHKYLQAILPYLHSKNVPVAYKRRENILEYPAIMDLFMAADLALALATSPKAADAHWFGALSMPCWNLNPAEIITLIQTAHDERQPIISQIYASDNERMKEAADFFADIAAKVHTRSADFIINQLCGRLFAGEDNYELFSNLNTLRDMLRTKTSHSNELLTLDKFCTLVHNYNAAEMAILNQSPYHESNKAVQILTVHSSKGLEFEHVFLIAADNSNWSDSKGNTDKLTLPRNLEYVRHTGDSSDEKIRVFFVAITRAKAFLYLTYSNSNFAGKNNDRLKYLDIREEGDTNVSRVIPKQFATVIASTCDAIATEDIAPNLWFDQYVPDDETHKNLLRPYVEYYRLSPTHLKTFIDLRYGDGPQEFLKRYIIGAPGESSFAASYGVYIHAVMNELNRDKISNEVAVEHILELINKADAEDDEKEMLKQRALAELPKFLAARGDFLRNTNAVSERSFLNENIVLGDAIITGAVDRIEIDEENKTITVADFKTGAPKSKWSTNDATFDYRIQLYFYKFLIENSRDYRNYRVTKGRIDFITPNDYGEITPLELAFTEKESAQIRTVVEKVFHCIKALDLPDTTEFLKQHDPTKAFFNYLSKDQ